MNCERARPELIGFHFGTLDTETRDAIESHIVECRACLEEFIALKRATECADETPMPSELSRARLRRAVADELRRGGAPWAWWERSLVVGIAAASVWLALGAMHAVATQEGRAPHHMEQMPR